MSLNPNAYQKSEPGSSYLACNRVDGDPLHPNSDLLHDGQSECGSISISPSELRYLGDDHWAAIRNSIAGLKQHLECDEDLQLYDGPDQTQDVKCEENKSCSSHALLLYGCPGPTSRDDILAALPPRSAIDRYLSRYFNRLDLVSCCQFPLSLHQISQLA